MLPLQFPLGGELRSHMLCGTGQKLNENRSYPKLITESCAWPGLYAMDLLSPLPLIQQSWTRGVLRWIPGLRWGKTAGLVPPGAVSPLSGHGSCPATRGTSGPAWAPGGGGGRPSAQGSTHTAFFGERHPGPTWGLQAWALTSVPAGGKKRPGSPTLGPVEPPEHPVPLFPGGKPLAVLAAPRPPFLHLQGRGWGPQDSYLLTLDFLACQSSK